jgi:hypothetical protein
MSIFSFRFVKCKGFRKDAAFNSDIAVGFEGIEEETFNSAWNELKSVAVFILHQCVSQLALMQYNLLKSTDVGNRVRYPV